MKIFKNNFSKLRLLSNQNIRFWNSEQEFEVRIPTILDVYTNNSFLSLMGLLDKDVSEFSKDFNGYEFKSHLDFIKVILALSEKDDSLQETKESFISGIKTFLPEFYVDDYLYIKDDILLTNDLFEKVLEVIYVSLGKERVQIREEDDEFTKLEKEAALRAKRIREAASKNKHQESHQSFDELQNLIAAILYEFPQYKLEDIFKLNIYTINYLFKQVGKIANYEVSKIAAGNGLTKKHKYFIEK